MKKFKDNISKIQPQLVSLFLVTVILIIVSIVIYIKVKKTKIDKSPKGIAFVAEQYVMGLDNLFKSIAGDKKIQPVAPYIFTLLSFLLLGNLLGFIGFEPPTSSYSVSLTLGLVTWIGTYVVSIMYQKLRLLKKMLNPLELIGQFTPLISISFRIFGNMIGGSTIMYLVYHVTGLLWAHIPYLGHINLLGSLLAPPFHLYFDVFDGIVQGVVFTLLTIVYWSLETTEEISKEKTNNKEKAVISKTIKLVK